LNLTVDMIIEGLS